LSDFARVFGRPSECMATAPGRVNLIGEPADCDGGYVLPLALPLLTRVELARRSDRTVQAASTTTAEWQEPVSYDIGRERRTGQWIDCVQGVTQALAADGRRARGFDLLVSSHVPVSSGLSSSAALEIALLRALRMAEGWQLDDLAVARLAYRGEAAFMDRPQTEVDALACSVGQPSHALFIQTATLDTLRVPMPASVELGIIDSGVDLARLAERHHERRRECSAAAAALGVPSLAELSVRDLDRVASLPPPLNRRARHVVTENARVLQAVAALTADHPVAMGALIRASHHSLVVDFEASLPAIDRLVALAHDEPLVLGARLAAWGSSGAVLLLCHSGATLTAARRVRSRAAEDGDLHPRVVVPPDRHES
jgi:galactokinase